MSAKKNLKMKYKNILLPMLLIWYVDIITTIIGLGRGLSEGNPRAELLLNLGWIGLGYWIVLGTFFIIGFAFLIYYVTLFIIKKNKKNKKKTSKFLLSLPIIVFMLGEAWAIINNLFLIFKTL